LAVHRSERAIFFTWISKRQFSNPKKKSQTLRKLNVQFKSMYRLLGIDEKKEKTISMGKFVLLLPRTIKLSYGSFVAFL
jgi:hypothetical protein